jgi:hypothetical protein
MAKVCRELARFTLVVEIEDILGLFHQHNEVMASSSQLTNSLSKNGSVLANLSAETSSHFDSEILLADMRAGRQHRSVSKSSQSDKTILLANVPFEFCSPAEQISGLFAAIYRTACDARDSQVIIE